MDIKKEVEKGFTCEGLNTELPKIYMTNARREPRARQREVRPDASPSSKQDQEREEFRKRNPMDPDGWSIFSH